MRREQAKQIMCAGRIVALSVLFVLLTISALDADTPDAPPHYHVVGFSIRFVLEGSHVVNQFGVVVGSIYGQRGADGSANNFQAYQWKNGALRSLKVSEGELPSSSPAAINDSGQIVGSLARTPGEMNFHAWGHAFLWERGKWQDLGKFVPDEVSYAKAINNKGEVAISAQNTSLLSLDSPHPEEQQPSYLYRKGRGVFLLGYKRVIALNNKSQVLLASWEGHYFLWDNGKTSEIDLSDKDVHSVRNMRDLNDNLQIIGDSRFGPFLYENGHFTFIDRAQESSAQSINNKGQVVGYFYPLSTKGAKSDESRAFLWQKGKLYDLNNLVSAKAGWVLEQAVSINDRGQIVGTGTQWGKPSNFLMTPIK